MKFNQQQKLVKLHSRLKSLQIRYTIMFHLYSGPETGFTFCSSLLKLKLLLPLDSLSFQTPRTWEDHLVLLFAPFVRRGPAFSEPSGISNSLKGGVGDCLKGGLISLASQFSLTSRLISCVASPDNCPPIWQLCHGCVLELGQRRSCWTWTSTTRGITVSSLRAHARGGLIPLCWHLPVSNIVDAKWGRKGGWRLVMGLLSCNWKEFDPWNSLDVLEQPACKTHWLQFLQLIFFGQSQISSV